MVSLQILSKVINDGDIALIDNNNLDDSYFVGYEEELSFIREHLKQYGNVPDKATFLSKFPNMELVDVNESEHYLIDTIREENLYKRFVPVIQKAAELSSENSNSAVQFLLNELKTLQPNYSTQCIDIVAQARKRYEDYIELRENPNHSFITTGFEELDDIVHGWRHGEDYIVLFARLGQGKSWILEKMCTHAWQLGYNVGYVSPEMSDNNVGYRFDTLSNHFSNRSLMWGTKDVSKEDYLKHIEELEHKENSFYVATPQDFDNRITVNKLRNWVIEKKLDVLAIDGIKYMKDERAKRGDNTTTSLTNISEDLMTLSCELKIPVFVVVQANRDGVNENADTPELESIRDSDGIAQNATRVISIRQVTRGVLKMTVKKNRYGADNGTLNYNWNIDLGDFVYVPDVNDSQPTEMREMKIERTRKSYGNESVF